MKCKIIIITIAFLLIIGTIPLKVISTQVEPFILEAPKNLSAEVKYSEDGLPYYEIKLDIPHSVKIINQNLKNNPMYYSGTLCYPVFINIDFKFGDYDWNEGPFLNWGKEVQVDNFLQDGFYQYKPFEHFLSSEVDIGAEVYSFRAYFYSDLGYIDNLCDRKVLSGYSNISTIDNTACFSKASE